MTALPSLTVGLLTHAERHAPPIARTQPECLFPVGVARMCERLLIAKFLGTLPRDPLSRVDKAKAQPDYAESDSLSRAVHNDLSGWPVVAHVRPSHLRP